MSGWKVTTPSALLGSGDTRLSALAAALRAHPWLGGASLAEALAIGVRIVRVS